MLFQSYNLFLQSFWLGKILGTNFQKALRAIWVEARQGFGVHWYVYTTVRRCIGFQQCLDSIEHWFLSDADALAGFAMPASASMSNSIDTLMNAEALAGFVPKGPWGLLEASSQLSIMPKC